MKDSPKLQVFCPVDPSELESTSNGVICRKCNRELVDVSSPAQAKSLTSGVCGVMRHIVGPVVGSALALSSCSLDGSSSDQLSKKKSQFDEGSSKKSEIPLPGIYYPPSGEGMDKASYPIAKPTDEPGIVISPYTQTKVDVSNIPKGTLVLDPAFKMEDKKFFRVP